MALGENNVLGIALGSSQAAGYVNPRGHITSWLNELAFAPVDYNPNAPVDEWSGDYGCGVQYFSQQAVGRLLPGSGLEVEAGRLPHQRARYDLVLASAVARMPALIEYMLPLARVGGRCIAMKGVTAEEETQDASHALQIIGGRLHRISAVQLPEVDQPHYLVVIEKTDATPKAYPRSPGTPTRKPL
jgi:hypothetical protein